jgi:hypothetical protein
MAFQLFARSIAPCSRRADWIFFDKRIAPNLFHHGDIDGRTTTVNPSDEIRKARPNCINTDAPVLVEHMNSMLGNSLPRTLPLSVP